MPAPTVLPLMSWRTLPRSVVHRRRALGPTGRLATKALKRVGSDRRRGARELALELLDGLDAELGTWKAATPAEQHLATARASREMALAQPAMGLFQTWSGEWGAIERLAPGRPLRIRLSGWVRRWRRRLRLEPPRIDRTVQRHLPRHARILTLSRGTTLLHALSSLPAADRPREIVVLESLPGGEGRRMAAELGAAGLRARWARDRSRGPVLSRTDLLLIGADTIEPDGAVIHKVGTRRLASEARQRGVPVVVVAGRSKWLRSGRGPRRLPPLFDRTPPSLVSAYWTDAGAVAGRGAGRPRKVR
ncbi:MAG: hypothetical protein ACLQD8_01575 [Thermoplasmata archaeon]